MKEIKYAIPKTSEFKILEGFIESSSRSAFSKVVSNNGAKKNFYFLENKENYITQSPNITFEKLKIGNETFGGDIFFSDELKKVIEKINKDSGSDDLNKAISHAYVNKKNGYEFIKVLTKDVNGANIPIQTINKQTIVELRPKGADNKSVIGDLRIIGWEESGNYYFTEIGMHKDINNNILKVISCLGEAYVKERINETISGGIFEVMPKKVYFEEGKEKIIENLKKAKDFYDNYEILKKSYKEEINWLVCELNYKPNDRLETQEKLKAVQDQLLKLESEKKKHDAFLQNSKKILVRRGSEPAKLEEVSELLEKSWAERIIDESSKRTFQETGLGEFNL